MQRTSREFGLALLMDEPFGGTPVAKLYLASDAWVGVW
ncbi:MAG: hypothetical protein QOK37_4187 [Thermoanaerobaculia bacterium]|nr:hypothetical protein [Thermoanaerobaculia bacterium]